MEQMSDAATRTQLVYLDNAATSFPKPPEVVAAVRACLDQSLTVQRSTHVAPFRGDEVLRRCRVKLARLLGASQPEEIVYAYSATDALNIALHGMVRAGGHVLTSPLEHHSVMRPLHAFRRSRGISFEALPADGMGVVDVDALRRLARPETCLVVINWLSNVSGTAQPIAEIGAVCRELGLPYLVDASQGTGSHPVDVAAIGCDAMALPAHKALLSLPGLGVLYARAGLDLPAFRMGGTGLRSELVEQPEERPLRLESGTPNVPAIVGLDAALDWLEQVGVEAVRDRCAMLTARLWAGVSEVRGVSLIGPAPAPERGFVVSFTVDGADPMVVAQILAEHYNISSRAGLHCAPTAHRYFGTYDRGGTVRFSPGWFTEEAQIDYAVTAVREVAASF
jgi:cysteine desulfurase/selenocysteine lyase